MEGSGRTVIDDSILCVCVDMPRIRAKYSKNGQGQRF